MKKSISRFLCDEEGASAIEYALVAAMVAVILVAFVPDIQAAVSAIFTSILNGLESGVPATS